MDMDKERYNYLSREILDACIEVHSVLGPGLLESVYQAALMIEFNLRGIPAKEKIIIPIIYKCINTGRYFEADIIVEDEIILELKSVETVIPLFEEQIISYLKFTDKRLGFLINFNVPLLKNGFKRFVNNF